MVIAVRDEHRTPELLHFLLERDQKRLERLAISRPFVERIPVTCVGPFSTSLPVCRYEPPCHLQHISQGVRLDASQPYVRRRQVNAPRRLRTPFHGSNLATLRRGRWGFGPSTSESESKARRQHLARAWKRHTRLPVACSLIGWRGISIIAARSCTMRPHRIAIAALAVGVTLSALVTASPGPQSDQHDHRASAGRLGAVHFATSCAPAVQKEFDRGVALLHSFWFSAAIESFDTVLKGDPRCAMAHWGIAMSWWGNPFGGFRSPQALKAGLAATDAAKASGAGTEREKAYVSAVDLLFRDASTVDQRRRAVAYEKAMEALAARYPDDIEARIFYALALDQTALPTDKTYANQLKAAGILEQEFKRQPEHPGLAHYIIHSFDVPALAPRALDAARRYAKIAPDAPHALHMPSHTFTRVGFWQESIDANVASAAAARKDNAASEELHALDYQAYAYLQTGQDSAARRTLDAIPALGGKIETAGAGNAAPPPAGYYALAAIPARYALERDAWVEAAALIPRQTPFAWADAVTHFARALGAARSGNVAGARQDIERLAAIRDRLEKANDAYWTEQVEIQRRAAMAWVTLAEGRQAEALTLMREAADMEDATDKTAVTPGPIKPARELVGEMLLQLNRPAEALVEFETTLKKEPNRFRATYGAARAAEAAGQREQASAYYASLLKITKGADQPGRKELAEARKSTR
jgi:hypothetical protein